MPFFSLEPLPFKMSAHVPGYVWGISVKTACHNCSLDMNCTGRSDCVFKNSWKRSRMMSDWTRNHFLNWERERERDSDRGKCGERWRCRERAGGEEGLSEHGPRWKLHIHRNTPLQSVALLHGGETRRVNIWHASCLGLDGRTAWRIWGHILFPTSYICMIQSHWWISDFSAAGNVIYWNLVFALTSWT